MKKATIITGVIVAMFLAACGGAMHKESSAAGFADNAPAPPPPPPGEGSAEDMGADVTRAGSAVAIAIERKLIKNGEVYFKTKNLSDTKKNILAALLAAKGYVSKENAYDYSENPSEELIVRVPSVNFDSFLTTVLQGAYEIDSKKIDIEDVTEQFVDIEARLKNKKQLEAKYQELLAKASNMEDILKIEKEISLIRQDIEAAEGRLNYLKSQVSYSTLKLTYYEKRSSGFNFGGKLGNALKDGGTGFLWFLIGMVNLWPLWLIGGVIWFCIARWRRRKRSKI